MFSGQDDKMLQRQIESFLIIQFKLARLGIPNKGAISKTQLKQAKKLLQVEIDHNNPHAMRSLAKLYKRRTKIPKENKISIKALERRAHEIELKENTPDIQDPKIFEVNPDPERSFQDNVNDILYYYEWYNRTEEERRKLSLERDTCHCKIKELSKHMTDCGKLMLLNHLWKKLEADLPLPKQLKKLFKNKLCRDQILEHVTIEKHYTPTKLIQMALPSHAVAQALGASNLIPSRHHREFVAFVRKVHLMVHSKVDHHAKKMLAMIMSGEVDYVDV